MPGRPGRTDESTAGVESVDVGIEHREPTAATAKELYANSWCCAEPGCQRPLYRVNPDTGRRILNSRIAHICARREGGPRWDPAMSEAENRSTSNLILLCLEHASEVDEHDRVAEFPVSLLREWKRGQLEDFDRLGHGGWNLSDAEVREVIESSFAPSFDLRGSVIRLGGDGGRAPAAGGGGGGVLGAFAAAGAGGKGGDLTLDGSPGEAPGAGGGGAGAVGPAVGGEGGGGGEYVKRWFSADELPDVVEVKVGRGGQGVKGGDGLDGENTSFGELVAQGGRGGRAGRMGEPVHQAGDHSAIRVSSAFFANAAELRDGLFHVRGGGWSTYTVRTLPGVLSGCVVLMLEVDRKSVV